RHQHWVALAKATFLTGDERYRAELIAQWRSWIAENPHLLGVNWTSPLELGLRLISWSYALAFARGAGGPFGDLGRILISVHQQPDPTRRNLSRHSSANNPLIGESAGLYVAGSFFRGARRADLWRTVGRAELIRAAGEQVYDDGANKEQAIAYHRFVLDLFLCAALVGRANGDEFPSDFWNTVERMTSFLGALIDANGNVPRLGDDDDGHVLVVTEDPHANPSRSLLATGAALFDRADLKSRASDFDEKSLWLTGQPGRASFERLTPERAPEASTRFADAGLVVLRCGTPGASERL